MTCESFMFRLIISTLGLLSLLLITPVLAQQTFTYSGELNANSAMFDRPEENCKTLNGQVVAFQPMPR